MHSILYQKRCVKRKLSPLTQLKMVDGLSGAALTANAALLAPVYKTCAA